MKNKYKVGMIGCGNISETYLKASQTFEIFEISACTDLNMDLAHAKAEEYVVESLPCEELLNHPEIRIILNLTPPQAHVSVSLQALHAGKHVYSEKPLALTRDEGKQLLETARQKGLKIGCAPDTFLGGGLQTVKKLLEDNWIGEVVAGTAHMMYPGPESWHPNPSFFYQKGAGPMFDIGPYYLTALVSLLGPVQHITAVTKQTFKERIATCEEQFGEILPVEVPTHYSGILEFQNGVLITLIISFDVQAHGHPNIELYGSEGSLQVPDPNTFGGPVLLRRSRAEEWQEVPMSHGYVENFRSLGIADMAYALESGRDHRCHGDLAFHVLDVMHAFEDSSALGKRIAIESRCPMPVPLPLGILQGRLDR